MIDVSAVVAQFGAYYIANPNNMSRLRAILYQPSVTSKFFAERADDDTVYRSTLSKLNRIVQPFQKAFTPIGDIVFTPNQFPKFKIKVDMEETPDDLEATYLGFLAALPELERANWPFIRWLVEVHVIAKIQEDLELNEYFSGVYAAPTAGTAGASGTAMNGLKKVIHDYNAAGRTNLGNGAIATGAFDADPVVFVTQVESFVDAIPKIYRPKLDFVFMTVENAIKFKRGMRKKYNTYYSQTTDLTKLEDYENISVVGLPSMSAAASNLIWTTQPDNRIRATKKATLANTMKIESVKRVVDLLTDWWEALNFEVPEFIFHNDQGLV